MKIFLLRIFTALALAATAANAHAHAQEDGGGVHQLRIYEVTKGNETPFHDRFRDHAARIMDNYDFTILAMWESEFEGKTEFVYLLRWPDEETMTETWEAFLADEEWIAIKKQTGAEHGSFVENIEDRTLHLTSYSPDISKREQQ